MDTDAKNQIWYTQEKNMITVGFTKSFLDSLDECWHILPACNKKFTKKAPLLTIETNDSLLSILSPFEGHFMSFNTKASNFPEKIVETDVIIEISLDKVQQQEVPDGWPEAPRAAQPFQQQLVAQLGNNQLFNAQAGLLQEERAFRNVPPPPRVHF